MAKVDATLGNNRINHTTLSSSKTTSRVHTQDSIYWSNNSILGTWYNWMKNFQRVLVHRHIESFTILVGHFLYVGSLFHIMTSEGDPLTQIVKFSVPYMFTSASVVPIWGAVLIEYISITTTFVWNYSDVFILLISIGLSTQFELFNDELMETQEVYKFIVFVQNFVQY